VQPKSVLPKAVKTLAQEFTRLPGIGPKTAQRLALYLLRQPYAVAAQLGNSIKNLHANVRTCRICFSLAEQDECVICRDAVRNRKLLCLVEDPIDIEALERTSQFEGRYHVLGGLLSPLHGISADQLTFDQLFSRIRDEQITELIIALDHSLEGEATTHYIVQHLKDSAVRLTRLARGLPTGGDIEFADAVTLTAALAGRRELIGPSHARVVE
jgi:recombination protein RecR